MFKKLGKFVTEGLNKALDFTQTQTLGALTHRYPDINEVLEVFERLKGNQNAIEGPSEVRTCRKFLEINGKYFVKSSFSSWFHVKFSFHNTQCIFTEFD